MLDRNEPVAAKLDGAKSAELWLRSLSRAAVALQGRAANGRLNGKSVERALNELRRNTT